jgi:ribonuclease R
MESTEYQPMTIAELSEALNIPSEEYASFVKEVIALEDEHIIYRSKKDKYNLIETLGYIRGLLTVHERGFGFVGHDEGEDIFVKKTLLNGAIEGDEVIVEVVNSPKNKRKEGRVVKITKRNLSQVVGIYGERKEVGYVDVDNKRINIKILVNKNNSMNAMKGHKVLVELVKEVQEGTYEGIVTKILGHVNDPGVDILSKVYNHNIKSEFYKETIKAAENVPSEIKPEDLKHRRDLREQMIVTIDGADAKDLDDAISVVKVDDNHYRLGVYIADVSHYVTEGSDLDKEAFERSTSVYLADRVIPMLPHRLSNGICSLNPQVDRLVMGCEMVIDLSGNVIQHEIFEAVINSSERMTYSDVNKILENKDLLLIEEYQDLVGMFEDMEDLASILRRKRFERGSLDFDIPEAKVVVDDLGVPIDIVLRERGTSEKIIEEFMLKANETIAEHFHWMNVPFIYRVHENPKEQKLRNFFQFVNNLGYKLKGSVNNVHPKTLQSVLNKVSEYDEATILSTLLLRSMQKARYDENSIGHYGLASTYYTHFTSPIRRYPDLIVHRLIKKYLIEGKLDHDTINHYQHQIPEIALHTSKKERDAIACERDVMDMKMAEYMEKYIGQHFDGMISSITSFGMFIELPNLVEGLVHVLEMKDDYYHYNEKNLTMVGERHKHVYKIGDKVRVKVLNASKIEGQIDFAIITKKKKNKPNFKRRR